MAKYTHPLFELTPKEKILQEIIANPGVTPFHFPVGKRRWLKILQDEGAISWRNEGWHANLKLEQYRILTGTAPVQKVFPELTPFERQAWEELRNYAEEFPDLEGFAVVYLDNCPLSADRRRWAAVLGSLTKKGLYRPEGDDCFGYVRWP